jgi:hypothetical protein
MLDDSVQLLDTLRAAAVHLAISEVMKLGEMNDPPLVVHSGGYTAKTADQSVLAESCDDAVDMFHAVQHRHDHGLWPNGGSYIFQGRIERVGFHREDDRVVWRRNRFRGDKLWGKRDVSVRADDLQPRRLELIRAAFSHEEGYVTTCLSKASAKISAG